MIIPETMRAVALDRHGGPSVLSMHRLPVPSPGANEVLIAVNTAGVGTWDAHMREESSDSGHETIARAFAPQGVDAVLGKIVLRIGRRDR